MVLCGWEDLAAAAGGQPPAVSQHNSFYLWGPGATRTDVVITWECRPMDCGRSSRASLPPGRVVAPYAMPYETRHPITVCRGFKIPLAEAWRLGKKFI